MSSLLHRFKSSAGTSGSRSQNAKKDPNAPQPTPLEKLVADVGPLRQDGSDKFFGMENFGSTCYCNSIIQCLYHSPPFREQVLNFPFRSMLPPTSSHIDPTHDIATSQNGHLISSALSPGGKSKLPTSAPTASPSRTVKTATTTTATSPQLSNKEDSKDSSEYKKKLALANGPLITLDTTNGEKYGMADESLFGSLKDIFEGIAAHESRTGVVSPQKFLDILRRDHDVFRAPMHQDAHEFLNLLLNQVVENVEQYSREVEMKSPKALNSSIESDGSSKSEASSAVSSDSSEVLGPKDVAKVRASAPNTKWVHELFEGTLTSETRCLTCENTSSRDEPFLDLSVDLDTSSSVTSCLLKFSEEEMLCERNKFHCDKCGGLQEAEKRMKIKRLPKILALHLKRFKYTEDLQRLQKLFHQVSYPYYLRLLNTTDDADESDRLYELYGVVVHIGGGPYHGHYVSIIKTQDRGWLLFDDENVEPVDKNFVCEFFGGDQSLACAYVLFYQETTVEAMNREQETMDGVIGNTMPTEPPTVNGKTNGAVATNGIETRPLPTTPMMEENEFPALDRSVTAPLTSSPPVVPSHVERLGPNVGVLPFHKKDQNQDRDDDSTTYTDISGQGIGLGLGEELSTSVTHPAKPPLGQQNNFMNRFRQTSKSIKGKQKLWGSGKFKLENPTGSTSAMTQVQQNLENQGMLAPLLPAQHQQPQEPPPEYPPPTMSLSQAALQHPLGIAEAVPPPPSSTTESNRSSGRRLSITSAALLSGNMASPRTPSPTAAPLDGSASKKKDKEKRSMFGFGKRKSNVGLGGF